MRQEIYALVRVIEQSIPTENTWARQIAQSLACCAQPTRDRGVATNRRSYTPAWIGSREAFGENPEMLIQWNGRPIDFAGSHDNRVTIPVEIRVPVLLGEPLVIMMMMTRTVVGGAFRFNGWQFPVIARATTSAHGRGLGS